MAPSSADTNFTERPVLLNEKFKVHHYDGGSFRSKAQYDVKNVLVPILEPFHCSGSGTKFNLVLKCSAAEDFTLTHFYVSGPGPRCTEPIRSGLVWVTEEPPDTDALKVYDNMSSEELMEVMKGLRSFDDGSAKSIGQPCAYFMTDQNSRESEVELSKWRDGKYVTIKFLDTHKDQVNIDVGIVALIGFFGRHAKQQAPLGPWMKRTARQPWAHPNLLKSMFSSSGWVCDGRDFTGGCRSGQTDFHQTSVYTVTFRCQTSGFDLCEKCALDPTLGRVTDTSMQADLEALADPATCKLAVTRLRNLWRRNWPAILPRYMDGGLLDTLIQALQKGTEVGGRPDEERISIQRQSGPETQKRQVRRALLQLTGELTQRILGIGTCGDLTANDLVWALCPEPEEHWDEGRLVALPKAYPSSPPSARVGPADAAAATSESLAGGTAGGQSSAAGSASAAAADFIGVAVPASDAGGSSTAGSAAPAAASGPTPGGAAGSSSTPPDPTCFLISWRDGQAPSRVHPRNVWKMTADEDVMMASASMYLELLKGEACDISKVQKYLQQGADVMATNGEGSTPLLAAIWSRVPADVVDLLLENGACPDVTSRDGATPLTWVFRAKAEASGDKMWFEKVADMLQKRGATVPDMSQSLEEKIARLRETFGLKMVGSLLTLQTPLALPVEVLEVIHLLLRELPLSVVKQALEPQPFRALTALLQHFVGGTDSLSTAVIGCRMMRSLIGRGDPTLQYLVRSHGALRWSQRLSSSKDVAQCGLYRQPHHEKVTTEELCKEAKALMEDLMAARKKAAGNDEATASVDDDAEWRENTKLAEITSSLDACVANAGELTAAQEALSGVRELLKKTEKGAMTDERCAAFELERSNLPGLLLKFLKHDAKVETGDTRAALAIVGPEDPIRYPTLNTGRWSFFRETFSEQTKHTRKGLARLMKAMHAVIETGEAFPVWRHKKERGLRALTEPLPLKLRHVDANGEEIVPLFPTSMRPHVAIPVEPLVHIGELTRYLVRVTPCIDEDYLRYCHSLVGATISDPTSGDRSEIVGFQVLHSALPLPIHTVKKEASGESQKLLLAMRDYLVLSPATSAVTLLEFRVALCKLHAVGGSDAYPALLENVGRALRGESTSTPPALLPPAPAETASSDAASNAASASNAATTGGETTGTAPAAAPSPPSALEQARAAAATADRQRACELSQKVLQEAVQAAAGQIDSACAILAQEVSRVTPPSVANADAEGESGAMAVEPSMRVHTVMIAVSEEIPFELFWPMVRDDIMGAVREMFPRSIQGMEEAVQAGVSQNGMGPIAQKLTLEEAEMLAARVGHVVQTAVNVDQKAVEELQKQRSEKPTAADAIPIGGRIQFSPKSMTWVPGVIIGHGPIPQGKPNAGPDKFDLVDEHGLLWEKLPRSKVRMPPSRRESGGGGGGTQIQAVLSQADLMRIREHLRRRQEEWAERHAQGGGGAGSSGGGGSGAASVGPASIFASVAAAAAGASGSGAAGSSSAAASAGASVGGPAASRPTSAPAIAQRPRASSVGAIDAPGSAGPRGVSGDFLSSREGSLGEVDPTSALEMVHFIDDEGIGDEDFDDDGDGPRDGDEGDEDDEDLPPLEPSEAGDSQADALPPRLTMSRSREGDQGGEGGSMEEELRVLEQLRAMEQIISEVLDPNDSLGGGPAGRPRRGEDRPGSEDFLAAPMANLRIRMGGGAEGVQTYQIRRASGSRGSDRNAGGSGGERIAMEALRGDFPAFVRAADSTNATSSLDHPVVERLGAADLVEEIADESMEPTVCEGDTNAPQMSVRFCLLPPVTPASAALGAADGAEKANAVLAPAPVLLPAGWNLLKAMQFLQEQQALRSADSTAKPIVGPAGVVQALQKVTLDNWSLGYVLDASDFSPGKGARPAIDSEGDVDMGDAAPRSSANSMDVDVPTRVAAAGRVTGRAPSPSAAALPAKKRRRTQPESFQDEVAREMYTHLVEEASPEGAAPSGPHRLIARCSENTVVADAIELLHLLRAQGPSLGVEASLWVSSKLDRKLRYQLEDPLSVVSGTLPQWATTLPRICPFLFSLKTRKMLLKYTAFGPSFAVHWTQENKLGSFLKRRATVQTELNAATDPRKMQELSQELSNIEEHVVKSNFWLGTLQSTLVKMQKGEETLLRQSDVAMELVSSSSHLMEVQFDGETGFGSAVTQSFYVEVAQLLQDRDTNRRLPMWVEDDDSTNQKFLLCRRGLLIKPLLEGKQRDEAVRRFRFLGRLMGQALREGFIVPLPLAEEFFALVLGEPLGASSLPRPGGGTAGELVGVLADFVADLDAAEAAFVAAAPAGRSPEELTAWRKEQAERTDFGERFLVRHDQAEAGPPQPQMSFDQYVSLVGACFLETGLSGAPLHPGGENVTITVENVRDFIKQASRFWFESGVITQVEAFRAGLNDVFPFECLVSFGRAELREMFCGEDRIEWDEQVLLNHLHPIGGLTDKSPTYKFLVAELVEMNQTERSRFLDFVSSCPRLPPGGLAKFHVDIFPDTTATAQGFPRSRACANQLYLPPYTTKEQLHEKLHEAMHSCAGHHEQKARDM